MNSKVVVSNIRKLIVGVLALVVVVIIAANSGKLDAFVDCQDAVQKDCAGDGLLKPTECYIKGAYGCFEGAVWPQATIERIFQQPTNETTPRLADQTRMATRCEVCY